MDIMQPGLFTVISKHLEIILPTRFTNISMFGMNYFHTMIMVYFFAKNYYPSHTVLFHPTPFMYPKPTLTYSSIFLHYLHYLEMQTSKSKTLIVVLMRKKVFISLESKKCIHNDILQII